MSEELKALEKIDHTICLAYNENSNALFNKDKYDHCDCNDIDDYIVCYDVVAKALKDKEKKDKALEIIKAFFKGRFSLHERKYLKFTEINQERYSYVYFISFDDKNSHIRYPISEKDYDLLKEIL